MYRVFADYCELARKSAIIFDLGVSGLIAIGITLYISSHNISSGDVITKLTDLTKVVIPAFAMQAGFHGTSLSIFSSSNTGLAKYLKENTIKDTNRRMIEQVYAYFGWAVITQLIVLFLAIVINYFFSYLSSTSDIWQTNIGTSILWYVSGSLIGGSIYAIFLTIRNVGILYHFLVVSARSIEQSK